MDSVRHDGGMTSTPSPQAGANRRVGHPRADLLNVAPEWLTRKQASKIAGVTARTVDRWRKTDKLRTFRRANGTAYRPILVFRDDLAELLAVAQDDADEKAPKVEGQG